MSAWLIGNKEVALFVWQSAAIKMQDFALASAFRTLEA